MILAANSCYYSVYNDRQLLYVVIYSMNTPQSFNLNYYSKHNRARQRKNITSLFTLLPTNSIHTGSSQQFRLKINIQRQNKTIRKQQFERFLNSQQSIRNLDGLNTLHESQRQQILSYIQKSSYQNSSYIINPAQSKISCAISDKFESSPRNSHHRELKSYKTAKQMINKLSFEDKDEANEHLVQSFIESQEQNLQQNPYSVVIARIDVNSHKIQIYQQEKEDAQNKYLLLEPLQPEQQCSQVSLSSLHQNTQKQCPDKQSAFQSQYEQKDFDDLINSPIQILEKYTKEQVFLSQVTSEKMIQTASLEEMLVRINESNSNIPQNQYYQTTALAPKQIQKEKNMIIQEKVLIKKVNFKALINKNKSMENDSKPNLRKERNKTLLLNFFDEN